MTPERAKELLPIITAFANGERIQSRLPGKSLWDDIQGPSWCDDNEYRIKPKVPEYRLFCYPDGVISVCHKNTGIPHEADNVSFKQARVNQRDGRWLTDWLPIPNYNE